MVTFPRITLVTFVQAIYTEIDTIKPHTWSRTPHRKKTKTQETSHTREPRGYFWKQLTIMLLWIYNTASQTRSIDNKTDPQKKHRLGTFNSFMVPTSHLFLMWIKTNRCLCRMNDPNIIDTSSPSKYYLDMKGDKTNIRTQQYKQLNTGVQDIQQLAQRQKQHQALTLWSEW